ncbi:MAG: hypothetical protein HQK91_10950 [Nitrospirae bacterium]|nr:hypothetical protein [Nitrospirota bacterium]MBF0541952.1 hypothetical protein [Nitrospirota bacterium]
MRRFYKLEGIRFISISLFTVIVLFTTSIPAKAVDVQKDNWVEAISTAFPVIFCQDDQYFRQCFNVTQSECEKVVLSATKVCSEKNIDKIPNILHQPDDGRYWGSYIGKCVASTFDLVYNNKFTNSSKCQDMVNEK